MTRARCPGQGRPNLDTTAHRVTETTSEQLDYSTWEHPDVDPALRRAAMWLLVVPSVVAVIGFVAWLVS